MYRSESLAIVFKSQIKTAVIYLRVELITNVCQPAQTKLHAFLVSTTGTGATFNSRFSKE